MTLKEIIKAHPDLFYRQQEFWAKVRKSDGCWIWEGYVADTGYGRWRPNSKRPYILAHRFSFLVAHGEIPEGHEIHHTCRNRRCVCPAHLRSVTRKEHFLLDRSFMALKAKQTHCVYGHEYSPGNTGRSGKGTRYCKECNRIQANRWYATHGKKERATA